MIRLFFILFFVIGFSGSFASLNAQSWKGQSLELSYHRGRILKHSPRLAYEIPDLTQGLYLNWQWQTFGQKEWQQHQRFPLIGLTAQYFFLGDPDVLGESFGLIPNLTLPLVRQPKWALQFQVGSGLAWLTQTFDLLENPKNNAIGSHLNNSTYFRGILSWRFHPNWTLTGGGSFTHFSNAASQMPNLGVNVPALSLGVRFSPQPLIPEDFVEWKESKKAARKWGLHAHFDLAYKETTVPGGPKMPVYIASVAGLYRLSKVNHLQIGIEYEYQRSLYFFGLHTFAFHNERDARQGATRWMIFVADEFLFGPVGILLQAGVYISPQSILVPWALYNKLALRYYLPPLGPSGPQIYLGGYMKSHKIAAEYFGMGVGVRL
jgi:hypothetical protein